MGILKMQIGWCAPLTDAQTVRNAGLDFLEVSLAPLDLESDANFAAAKKKIAACPLPTPAFNMLFPKHMRVVGEEIDEGAVKNYLSRVAELLHEAGARVVVYGSGWSRNIPDRWERERGEQQFLQALAWCADKLKGTGTTLVIEPLNRKESNLINSVTEGAWFAEQVNRPEIKLLADFYHMDEEKEPLEVLVENAEWLAHIHLADTGRRNPGTGHYDYKTFFAHLTAIKYSGMMSAECKIENPEADMRHSLAFLRQYWPRG
jgi:sugar phosphate isomerase/epimerase